MFYCIRNNKSLSLALFIVLILFCLYGIAYAASYVLNSGEFIGLGNTEGRIVFTEQGEVDDITFLDGKIGINVIAPGQRLHIGDGNVLIEGGGETAMQFKRDATYEGPSGISQNPIFELGRIIQAGDGDPEFRFIYSDDNTLERSVFEFDRKGIVASVKPDRGSHFEGFISNTDPEPIFRLNSFPKMRLEMGNGGSDLVDVAIQRESTNTLTFLTGNVERVRINSNGIEVSDGYIKLNTSSGKPPISDCENDNHIGRMKVDSSLPVIYICTAKGWGKKKLGGLK